MKRGKAPLLGRRWKPGRRLGGPTRGGSICIESDAACEAEEVAGVGGDKAGAVAGRGRERAAVGGEVGRGREWIRETTTAYTERAHAYVVVRVACCTKYPRDILQEFIGGTVSS